MGVPIVICYGGAEEAAKHKHSPKREETSVIESGSDSKLIAETNNVILRGNTSEQEEKSVDHQGKILPIHDMSFHLEIAEKKLCL